MLEGVDALPEEHVCAGGGVAAAGGGGAAQGGIVGDDVVDILPGGEMLHRDGQGVTLVQAEASGVDNEVGCGKETGQLGGIKMSGAEGAAAVGLQLGAGLLQLRAGAVHQCEVAATGEGALAAEGCAGATAGAKDDDAQLAERFAAGELADGALESGTIGVEGVPAVGLPEEGVGGTAELGERICLHGGGEGFFLERNGDVDADEAELLQASEQVVKILFFQAALDVDVGGVYVRGIQRRLLHLRRFGVGNGVADNGKPHRFGAACEVFWREPLDGIEAFHTKNKGRCGITTPFVEV